MTYPHTHNLKRINITLPEETLKLLDKVADYGSRSRFIDHAIRFYTDTVGKKNLRKGLKEGALVRADRDMQLVEEWFLLDS